MQPARNRLYEMGEKLNVAAVHVRRCDKIGTKRKTPQKTEYKKR